MADCILLITYQHVKHMTQEYLISRDIKLHKW